MEQDVCECVSACLNCHKSKQRSNKALRLSQPLPIHDRSWQSVSIYLLTGLPAKDVPGNDGLVQRFITSQKRHTSYCAHYDGAVHKAVFRTCWCLDGSFASTFSDRDPRLVRAFWAPVANTSSSKAVSAGDHPQTDGQTDGTIRNLAQVLREYVDDDPTERGVAGGGGRLKPCSAWVHIGGLPASQ